jgi:hypothetical protein
MWAVSSTPRQAFRGPVAQLGARLTGSQKVRGSNPLGSTTTTSGIHRAPFREFAAFAGALFLVIGGLWLAIRVSQGTNAAETIASRQA